MNNKLKNFLRNLRLRSKLSFRYLKLSFRSLKKLDYKYYIGIFVVGILIVGGAIFIFRAPESAEAEWFNDSWYYRQSINISNSGSTQANTQVKILDGEDLSALVSAGKLQSDLDDLRFTDMNGNLLKYWIEDSTNSSVDVWVFLPSVPTGGAIVYMYYGHSNVEAGKSTIGTSEYPGISCKSILLSGITTDGVYYIDPTAQESADKFEVYCNMTEASGGWALLDNFVSTLEEDSDIYGAAIDHSNITTYADLNSAGYVTRDINAIDNTYYTRMEGYLQMYYGGSPVGYIEKTLPLYTDEVLVRWGNWYGGSANLKIDGSTVQSLSSNHGAATYQGTYSSGDVIRFEESGIFWTGEVWVRDSSISVYGTSNISSSSPSSEERGPAPVGYWSFDEGYGTTAHDETSNSNDGTITGATWQTEDQCIAGKCLYFDGSDDYINTNLDVSDIENGLTVSAWIRINLFDSTRRRVIAQGVGAQFIRTEENSPQIYPYLRDNNGNVVASFIKSDNVQQNEWLHIVLTIDPDYSGYIKLYINGDLNKETTNILNTSLETSGGVQIGGWNSFSNGFIDEPKIYPYARTEAQVKNDYNAGLAGISSSEGVGMSLGGQSQKSLSDGLVGYWKMDESSWSGVADEVVDASGNENHGTAQNSGTTTSTAKFGMAGEFDGTDDYVNCGSIDQSESFSVSTWINRQTIPTQILESYLYVSNSVLRFSLADDSDLESVLRWKSPDGNYTSYFLSDSNSLNGWFYLTIVYDGVNDILRGYKNGILQYTYNDVAIYEDFGGSVYLGANLVNGRYFDGSIDEMRIYNRALSSREVKQLYEYAPGPVAYYDFEEKEGTTLYDKSGNGNDGSLNNMDENTDWVLGKYGSGLDFDGENDSVSLGLPDILQMGEGIMTVSHWVKPDIANQSGSVQLFFGNGGGGATGYGTRILADGRFSYEIYGSEGGRQPYSVNIDIVDGEWNYITAIFDGVNNQMIAYLNGMEKHRVSISDPGEVTASYDFRIGSHYTNDYFYNSQIDEVKIYNYARTQKQILEDMNGGKSALNSPLVYLNFDEGYGSTANDSSIYNYDSTITSGTWADGKNNKALDFDGSTTMVDIPYNDFDMDEYSFSFWLKTDTNSTIIFNTYYGTPRVRMQIYQGDIRFNIRGWNGESTPDIYVQGTSSIVDNEWHHIVGVKDHDYLRIYVDGVKENEATGVDNVNANSGRETLGLGAYGSYHDDYVPSYVGSLDDFKIFNYALSEDEILQDYNQGKSMTLGSKSTESDGVTASNSSDRSYCVPGDTATCNPPIAEWKFDEKTGTTAYDTTGNGNNGTLTNMNEDSWVRGKIGGALDFDDEINSYVVLSQVYTDIGNQSWTISGWVNIPSTSSGRVGNFLGNYNDSPAMNLEVHDDGQMRIWYNGLNIYGTTDLRDNEWHYLSFIRNKDDDKFYMYIDGVYENEYGSSGSDLDFTEVYWIGSDKRSGGMPWQGKIDQVQIYDYARTPAQIAWDYNKGAPIAYWSFDEGEGSTAHDETDNLNHGILNNMDPATDWLDSSDCMQGSCLDFDGSYDYVDCGSANDYDNAEGSTSLWFNTSSGALQFFIGDRDAGGQYFQTWIQSGIVQARISDGSNYDTNYSHGGFADGSWHHLVVTWGAAGLQVYVDGEFIGSNSYTGTWVTDSNMRLASVEAYQGTYNLDGKLDEVKIYNYALTPLQVQQDYNMGKAIYFK